VTTVQGLDDSLDLDSGGPSEQARTALREALRLARAGYRLTPVTIRRLPNGKKAPTFHQGWRHESAWSDDTDQILAWWTDHPDTSFAIGCGVNGIEGVDLDVHDVDSVEQWAADQRPISTFTQWTPSGGAHLIWKVREDGRGLPQEVKATLPGVDTRNRAGLFFAAGSYVVGEEGTYEAPTVPALDLLEETPLEVVELFAKAERDARADRPTDGRIVTHDVAWQRNKTREALTAMGTHGRDEGGYRAKLQHAGLFLGRLVEEGLETEADALEMLLEAHRRVWGGDTWPENLKDMRDALADGPRLERWRSPDPRDASSETSGSSSSADDAEPVDELDAYQRDLALEVRRQDIREDARNLRLARDRAPFEILDFAAFLDAPQPDYLLPGAIYRDGTSKVFGAPGSGKTFWLLDAALALASGGDWFGHELEQAPVHYVMAEGQATNTARSLAWLWRRGVDPAGVQFRAIPRGVLLTPEGIERYLLEVQRDRPALVVLDTKNRMMVGEENSASDNAVMIRAMDAIREASGGAVVIVDHTGVTDVTRGRGSNALEAAMDTEVRVQRDGQSGYFTAQVTRDKASEPGASWAFRLERCERVPGIRPGTPTPAVLMPAEESVKVTLRTPDDWTDVEWPLPVEIASYSKTGAGGIRPLARFLRSRASGGIGVTMAEARKAVLRRLQDDAGGVRKGLPSADTIDRAWGALVEMNRLEAIGSNEAGRSKWVERPDDPPRP
jgi:hypothetical protein